jgi:thiosulfate/3-mercaptopyruvate sulfurtransferase
VRAWPLSRLATIEETADATKILIDARNVPCRENLTAEGTFLPIHELRRRFEEVGVTRADQVISYCGSGVTACHNLLALE